MSSDETREGYVPRGGRMVRIMEVVLPASELN
jgi:hypothetical protein